MFLPALLPRRFGLFVHQTLSTWLQPSGPSDCLPEHLFIPCVIPGKQGFDIIYALQDEAFDRSFLTLLDAASFCKKSPGNLFVVTHACRVRHPRGLFRLRFIVLDRGTLFIALLIYQHSLVKPDDPRRVNLAFSRQTESLSGFRAIRSGRIAAPPLI